MNTVAQGLFLCLTAAAIYMLFFTSPKKTANHLSRGWGDEIDWVPTYEEGLAKSKSNKKPLMVIQHLLDCPYSKGLKERFAANAEIQKIAKEHFVMLNLIHETTDNNLAPDGYYVPRIIFIDPSLTVRNDLVGKHPIYKYTYTNEDILLILKNMQNARTMLNTEL
uniref:Anterior gradient protein 3-like n=1 Tax=Erpetoichthys calabaricus TaxID=27687 RepID=A0A8C4T688_ERPCA